MMGGIEIVAACVQWALRGYWSPQTVICVQGGEGGLMFIADWTVPRDRAYVIPYMLWSPKDGWRDTGLRRRA